MIFFFFNRLELTQMWQQRSPWSSKGFSCSCPCAAWSPGPGSWSTSPWWTPPWIQSPSLPARGVCLLQIEKKLGPSYQLDRHDRLVVVWKLVVEGHDDTVCHDGYDDDPLEGRPIDLELFFLPRDYFQCWNFSKIWRLTCCQNVNDNFKGLIDVSSASLSCWQWQSYFANRPTNKHQFTFPIILGQMPKSRFCQTNFDVTYMTLIRGGKDNNISDKHV